MTKHPPEALAAWRVGGADPERKETMSDHPLTRRCNLKLLRLTKAVSTKTGVPVEEITGRSRRAPIVQARWLCWYWARQMYGYTLQRIAAAYGVDHTSVSHALKQLEKRRGAA